MLTGSRLEVRTATRYSPILTSQFISSLHAKIFNNNLHFWALLVQDKQPLGQQLEISRFGFFNISIAQDHASCFPIHRKQTCFAKMVRVNLSIRVVEVVTDPTRTDRLSRHEDYDNGNRINSALRVSCKVIRLAKHITEFAYVAASRVQWALTPERRHVWPASSYANLRHELISKFTC